MIAHHAIYSKVYKKYWIATMIFFCWIFSYGMQIPTLVGVWGKPLLYDITQLFVIVKKETSTAKS